MKSNVSFSSPMLIRWLCLLLSMMMGFSAAAPGMAETVDSLRTPAEREIDALMDAHLRTKNLPGMKPWEESAWYAQWQKEYGLTGDYHPSMQGADPAEEERLCDLALSHWQMICGITNTNDYSFASECYLFEQVLDDATRQLALIVRIHDPSEMPDFYVLIDRNTQEILATSDVAVYQAAMKQQADKIAAMKENEQKILEKARLLLHTLMGGENSVLKKDVLRAYEWTAYAINMEDQGVVDWLAQIFPQMNPEKKNMKWYVHAYPTDRRGTGYPDFLMVLDETGTIPYEFRIDTSELEAMRWAEREEKRQEILAMLGSNWGAWSLEEKAQYGEIYNGNTDYGLPGENDLEYQEALNIAHDALMETYPELTKDALEQAVIHPYFYTDRVMLYGTYFDAPIYYLSFFLDGDMLCYEIILDGQTGQVYLLHDPQSSGNG